MQTLDTFIRSAGLTMTVARADDNPDMASDPDWSRSASHWRCTIRNGRARMVVPFSQGSAHKAPPTLADVLDCLASDAASLENARGFEDWASEYGYDTDSRRAEKTFRTVEKQAKRLKRLLGDSAYETLLWDTERL